MITELDLHKEIPLLDRHYSVEELMYLINFIESYHPYIMLLFEKYCREMNIEFKKEQIDGQY